MMHTQPGGRLCVRARVCARKQDVSSRHHRHRRRRRRRRRRRCGFVASVRSTQTLDDSPE